MKIVCASNMPYAKEAFSTLGETVAMEGRSITAADVRDAEILALRSTTKVDEALLAGSQVRFAGTATIGTDHMDQDYLAKAGITWCYSPGCNANSVSEYVTAALLCLAERHGVQLAGKTMGVVGVGNVGSLVVRKAEALGLRVLQNDPPKAREQSHPEVPVPYVELDQILAESDIVTMHVPLTREGQDATYQMVDTTFFAKMKPHCIFINAARGPIMATDALLSAMDNGTVSHAIMDTWEGEPDYREDLLGRVDIGTPHIAGHSFEGKVMGTVMVYQAACKFLGVEATWSPDALLPDPLVPEVTLGGCEDLDQTGREMQLREVVKQVYDIEGDDRRLRDRGETARKQHFDTLRKQYPMRREFRFTHVNVPPGPVADTLAALGFIV